jgi:hypothetical protein
MCKHLSESFPVYSGQKQGDSLSLLLFCLALEYAIRKFQENKDEFEWDRVCGF